MTKTGTESIIKTAGLLTCPPSPIIIEKKAAGKIRPASGERGGDRHAEEKQ